MFGKKNKLIIEMVNSVLWITLNRADKHNALDHEMVTELSDALQAAESDSQCRLVVLQAVGKTFCAGHDLKWMRHASEQNYEANLKEANHLANFFNTLYYLRKPTIAVAQGPAFGGGVCLLACCDYVLATFDSHFGFPEVKLGLIPAVITPFIINAIGTRQAQRLFITGETFSVEMALRLGLVHDIINPHELRHRTQAITEQLMKNGPEAMVAAKSLMHKINPYHTRVQQETTTQTIATLRSSDEAVEGMNAFFERRLPKWTENQS